MALITRGTSDGYIMQGATAVTVSSSTETSIASATIQASSMGENKALEFSLRGRLTTPLLAAPNGTLRLKFGSTTLVVLNQLALTLNLSAQRWAISGRITNTATNAQDVGVECRGLPAGFTANSAAWAVDTTADRLLDLTWEFGALNLGASSLVSDWFWLEVK